MKFHTEILSNKQRELLGKTGAIINKKGFYLAGGTAVALCFGHRKSIDFDWFFSGKMEEPEKIQQFFEKENIDFQITNMAPGTLHGTIDGVRFSFLEYKYPLLNERIKWENKGVMLASLSDLACMKLSAIAQRGSRKDFVDIYVLLEEQFSLAEIFELYKQKYQKNNIAPVLYSLSYFDDAEEDPMPEMLREFTWGQVKKEIKRRLKKFLTGK
jgi:hypothetical protein